MDRPTRNGGHMLTQADRQKGWHTPKPQMAIINAIKNRKKCNPRCMIFELCPMMPLSMSRANVEGACLLNRGGNVLIRRFVNLMVKGEDGLLNEINNVLYSYAFDIETAPPSIKKDYIQMCLSLHNQVYAKKDREQEARPNLTVVINEMGADGKMREIIPVVESGHIRLGRGVENQLIDAVREAREEDGESLMDSPLIEEIMDVSKPYKEVVNVPEQDSRTEDDAGQGTEGEPEELEETPETSGGGS